MRFSVVTRRSIIPSDVDQEAESSAVVPLLGTISILAEYTVLMMSVVANYCLL